MFNLYQFTLLFCSPCLKRWLKTADTDNTLYFVAKYIGKYCLFELAVVRGPLGMNRGEWYLEIFCGYWLYFIYSLHMNCLPWTIDNNCVYASIVNSLCLLSIFDFRINYKQIANYTVSVHFLWFGLFSFQFTFSRIT